MRQLLKFSENNQHKPLTLFLRFTVDPYQNSRLLLKEESTFHFINKKGCLDGNPYALMAIDFFHNRVR